MSFAERITRLAAHAVMGKQLVKVTVGDTPPEAPLTPDTIAEARTTTEAFAARLRELQAARVAFDAAVTQERSTAHLDLADAIAAGEPLPDVGEVESTRAKAEIRVRALFQLAQREAPSAKRASHTVKCAALAEVTAAREAALRWVIGELPPVFERPEAVALQSKLVLQSARAVDTVQKTQGLRLQTAELFGYRLPSFRTTALPAQPEILPCDGLDPDGAARELDALLRTHGQAVRFHAAVLTSPASAYWVE